jgi:hypothetical protein
MKLEQPPLNNTHNENLDERIENLLERLPNELRKRHEAVMQEQGLSLSHKYKIEVNFFLILTGSYLETPRKLLEMAQLQKYNSLKLILKQVRLGLQLNML